MHKVGYHEDMIFLRLNQKLHLYFMLVPKG
uniref:Uncharacterized protein n=1 Tax=Arundo donax TaxID=35708 RepID=A0A0A8ZB14_ARUDO